jgi:predicted PurR-regulated permease PerM
MAWSVKQLVAAAVILSGVALAALFALHILRVFILAFAGVLIAIFLRGCADWLKRRFRIPQGLGVALVILGLIGFFALSGWLLAPRVEAQFSDFQSSIPKALHELTQGGGRGQWSRLMGTAATSLFNAMKPLQHISEWLVDIVVVAFVSVYLAAQPRVYREGVLLLFPAGSRATAAEVLGRLEHTLWRWFIGRIVGMVAIGVLVFLAMWSIGFPLAFTLGLLAAVFEFVPYVGAIVSSIPAILLAFATGTSTVWLVAVLYLMVHGIDGYIVIPLVERRAVRIAPALTIVVQLAMFLTAGLPGVLIADPLTASALVLVQTFYIQQSEDRPRVPSPLAPDFQELRPDGGPRGQL